MGVEAGPVAAIAAPSVAPTAGRLTVPADLDAAGATRSVASSYLVPRS